MTADEIIELGQQAEDHLLDYGAVRIEYQPGNGTRYDMVVTSPAVQRIGRESLAAVGVQGHWTIGIVNFGTLYEMHCVSGDVPHPDYIADKLCDGRLGDGRVLHLLLAAMLGDEPSCSLEEAGLDR